MTEPSIRELESEGELRAAYPVMRQLRPQHDENAFVELASEMMADGYRLFAVEDEGRIVALAGIGFGLNLYYGRYLWVYELITDGEARSEGHGRMLMEYLEVLARREGCDTLALSSALRRVDAHRFYLEKVEMEKVSYTFEKKLS